LREENLIPRIEALLSTMSLIMNQQQLQQLDRYLHELYKWNKAYNLTAVRELLPMLTYHVADSLSLVPYVQGELILDVGSGAGLPGMILAIFFPDKKFTLVDSNGKKVRFIQQMLAVLGLTNVIAIQERMESLSTPPQFDVIMARAVATLAKLVAQTKHLLASGGCYVLQKGVYPTEELKELSFGAPQVKSLSVPGLDAQRHVVIIQGE
jgi:16S rRNA (guanine527-N7)-methyltransferase